MMRGLLVAGVATAAAAPATSAAADTTPSGPATLTIGYGPLRRALAGGALSAEITARTITGRTPVTTKVTVSR